MHSPTIKYQRGKTHAKKALREMLTEKKLLITDKDGEKVFRIPPDHQTANYTYRCRTYFVHLKSDDEVFVTLAGRDSWKFTVDDFLDLEQKLERLLHLRVPCQVFRVTVPIRHQR